MRPIIWIAPGIALRIALGFALASAPARAQQEAVPSAQDGPTTVPMTIPTQPAPPPRADADGVYHLGPGITPPILAKAVEAAYPPGAEAEDRPRIRVFAAVVGVDGRASQIHPLAGNQSDYDAGAIEAIQASAFQPGELNGVPVPVLVHLRVAFFHLRPALPVLLKTTANLESASRPPDNDPYRSRPGDTQPKVLRSASPEYSEQARAQKIQGFVTVSLLITEDGLPTEIKVVKPLGYGLDEKAVDAAGRYSFEPAMRDGKAIPARIMIQMNFRLY